MNPNKIKQITKINQNKKILFDKICGVYIFGYFCSIVGFGYYGYKEAKTHDHIHKKRKFWYICNNTWDGIVDGCLIGIIWPIILPMAIIKYNNE